MRSMLARRRTAVLALTLLALRALVPVGYMLALPASSLAAAPALSFCPTQNPALDLSLIAGVSDSTHAHHHGHTDPGDGQGEVFVDAGSTCPAWLGSAAAVIHGFGPAAATAPPSGVARAPAAADCITPAGSRRPPTRAPPVLA